MRAEVRQALLSTLAVCIVCSVAVSSASVLLGDRQEANRQLQWQEQVLAVSGVVTDDLAEAEVRSRFRESVEIESVALAGGETRDVYVVREAKRPPVLVLPVEGKGMWSLLRGLLAVSAEDGETIVGITFHEHGETPGLGGEVDNPRWKARWAGRRAFDDEGNLALRVIKGRAGPPEEDPHRVDGISGATVTSTGVTEMLGYWLGEQGYGPLLAEHRRGGEAP